MGHTSKSVGLFKVITVLEQGKSEELRRAKMVKERLGNLRKRQKSRNS